MDLFHCQGAIHIKIEPIKRELILDLSINESFIAIARDVRIWFLYLPKLLLCNKWAFLVNSLAKQLHMKVRMYANYVKAFNVGREEDGSQFLWEIYSPGAEQNLIYESLYG